MLEHDTENCPEWCHLRTHPVQLIHAGPVRTIALPAAPDGTLAYPPIPVQLIQADRHDDAAGWVPGSPEIVVGPWRLPVSYAQSLAARIDATVREAVEGEPRRRKLMPWNGDRGALGMDVVTLTIGMVIGATGGLLAGPVIAC